MRFHTFACVACTGQLLLAVAFSVVAANMLQAQTVVPGTGERVLGAGDNFEDTSWEFQHHFPKGSHNVDGQIREPRGISKNGLWYESAKRGQPDVLKRVAPPAGGLLGSKGALLMRTLYSAIPERVGRGSHQDDLLFYTSPATGGAIPVSQSPSVVVRVYLPPSTSGKTTPEHPSGCGPPSRPPSGNAVKAYSSADGFANERPTFRASSSSSTARPQGRKKIPRSLFSVAVMTEKIISGPRLHRPAGGHSVSRSPLTDGPITTPAPASMT